MDCAALSLGGRASHPGPPLNFKWHCMTHYDLAALAWFLITWRLYAWSTDDSRWSKLTLSYAMHEERRRWMLAMARRPVRILDGNIISGLQNSTSFFASTALLGIGAGFGLISASDELIRAMETSAVHLTVNTESFYLKVLVLMGLFAYAFFKFGWSYRLFNYAAIMMAASPEAGEPEAEEKALVAAEMNISASKQFNYGLRSFFMTIPVLAWFVGALAFAFVTTMVIGALAHRQFWSKPRSIARDAIFDTPQQASARKDDKTA